MHIKHVLDLFHHGNGLKDHNYVIKHFVNNKLSEAIYTFANDFFQKLLGLIPK